MIKSLEPRAAGTTRAAGTEDPEPFFRLRGPAVGD